MKTKFVLTSNEDEKDMFIAEDFDDGMDLKTQRETYKMFRKILTKNNKKSLER